MAKDWTGNTKTAYAVIGASNHTEEQRQEDDYYATEPKAMELLLQEEKFDKDIWECAVGGGHLADVLKQKGYRVLCSDIVNRGYNETAIIDFLKSQKRWIGDIITNPPYKYAKEFVEHALELIPSGNKVAMFLKLTFLEGKARKEMYKRYPPKVIYVSSSRLQCAKNGDFIKYNKGTGTAIAYAWYVWEKGYTGHTIVKWIN